METNYNLACCWLPNHIGIPYASELQRLFPDSAHYFGPQQLGQLQAIPTNTNQINANSFFTNTINRQRHTSTSSYGSFESDLTSDLDSSPSLTPSSLSPLASPGPSSDFGGTPWDDFTMNGHESELDELDKLMRRLNLDRNVRSSTSKPMSGRAEELLNGNSPFIQNSDEDPMIIKNRLIQLLRQQERAKSKGKKSTKVCVFCRNNGEAEVIYSCHQLKDEDGNITCPILYCYTCPKCGATKDNAHTLKYCPLSTGECPTKALRTARTSAGRRRFP